MESRPATRQRMTKTRTIVLLGFEGCAALDITGPHEVFALSSHLAPSDTLPLTSWCYSPNMPAPFVPHSVYA